MMSLKTIVVVAAGLAPVAAAYDYPTMDRVDHVMTCMRTNGGQNIDNLQRCSCEIDVIAQQLAFDDFNAARTYEIYKQMPGEKGSLFRESELGDASIAKLAAAREDAKKRCFVGAVRQKVVPGHATPEKMSQQTAP